MHAAYTFCCKHNMVGNGDVYCSILQLLRKLCSSSFKRLDNPMRQRRCLHVPRQWELLLTLQCWGCWREWQLPIAGGSQGCPHTLPIPGRVSGRACISLTPARPCFLTSAGMAAVVVVVAVSATSSKNPARTSSNASLCCWGSSSVCCKMPDTWWT